MHKSSKYVLSAAVFAAGIITASGLHGQEKSGNVEKGKEVFEQCAVCHNADSAEKKMGPGLKGLFKKDKMAGGKKPTYENVLQKINEGGGGMPGYKELLSSEESVNLMAYLKSL